MEALVGTAQGRVLRGEMGPGLDDLQRAMHIASDLEESPEATAARQTAADIHLHLGRTEAAEALLAQTEPFVAVRQRPLESARQACLGAAIAVAQGKTDTARDHLGRARQHLATEGGALRRPAWSICCLLIEGEHIRTAILALVTGE